MGVSPFGYVEGSELSQEQLTAHLKSLPSKPKPKPKIFKVCPYCKAPKDDNPHAQICYSCGAPEFAS